MPKAYWVVTYRSVSDPQKLAAYAKLAVAATAPFGARFLARGDPAVAYEQGLKERTVITEYPSLKKATASYDSPAYQEALKALEATVLCAMFGLLKDRSSNTARRAASRRPGPSRN
jgi:uncharacterized protein (DUF1330 family)